MKSTSNYESSNPNEMYTYIAIPIEALQQSLQQGGQAITISILKSLPDDISTPQIEPVSNHLSSAIVATGNNNNAVEKQSIKKDNVGRPSVIELNNSGTMKKSQNVVTNKSRVRYLTTKSSQNKKTKDSNILPFKCSICGEILTKMSVYRKHMEMHKNSKKYKCEQCSAGYNVEENLKLHMAMHNKGPLTCPICTDRKFQRLASLKAHILLHEIEEMFTCIECLVEFEKEEDLCKHMSTHKVVDSENNGVSLPMVCSFCRLTFNDATKYKEHISCHIKTKRMVMTGRKRKKVNGDKNYPYKCDVCKKTFLKYCLLERHVRIHSGEKPFACHLCERAFNQKGTLQIHLARHSGLKPFHCLLCPAKFCQKGNLRVHVRKTHEAPAPGDKIYKCTMCSCVFKKVSSLNAHITRGHASERQCDDVSTIMNQLKQLEDQMTPKPVDCVLENRTVENGIDIKYVKLVDSSIEGNIRRYLVKQRKVDDILWYLCSYCSKEFKKPSDLIRHIRVHTREKPYKCKQCDQAFSLKSTLATHIHTHAGKRQYECVMCSKQFTSIRTLDSHFRRHEKRSLQYTCSMCTMTFPTVAKAKMHMDLHQTDSAINKTGKAIDVQLVMQQPMVETLEGLLPLEAPNHQVYSTEGVSAKIRPHKCQSCNAAFAKGGHLKRHMLIHTGERKFKCTICSKSFYLSYALKEHMKFHSGERNYSCNLCGNRFVTNAILKRHLPIHSSIKPYICPYCKKRFKTVLLCRKHINVHKRELSMKLCTVNETGELSNSDTETNPTLDLNESLNGPFSNPLDGIDNISLPLENITSLKEIPVEPINIDHNKDNLNSKILYTAENGIVISTDFETDTDQQQFQNVDNVLQNILCQQLYQTIPPNYDKSQSLNLLPENVDLDVEGAIGTLSQENLSGDLPCPMFYINCDDLQSLTTTNLYNGNLTQSKTNDPLLLSQENEIQDSSTLLPSDTTFNPTDFQLDYTQGFEMLMPFTFSSNLTLPGGSFPNVILSNIEDSDIIPPVVPNEMKSLETYTDNVDQNLHVASIKPIEEETVLPSLIYNNISLECNPTVPSTDAPQKVDFACSYCKRSMKDLNDLNDHICDNVNTVTKESEDVNQAIEKPKLAKIIQTGVGSRRKSNGGIKDKIKNEVHLKCSECEKILPNKNAISRHMLVHKEKKNPSNFQCTYCEKHFKKRSDLERHIRTHTGEKPYSCDKCDKSFSLKSTLDSHSRTHNPGGNKDFVCAVCSACFSSKAGLRVHLLIHTGVKPYQCSMCPEKFRTSGHRKCHMAHHTKKVNTKKSTKLNNLLASIVMDTQTTNVENELAPKDDLVIPDAVKDSVYLNQALQVDPILLQQLQLNNVLLEDDTRDISFVHVDINNDTQIKSLLSNPIDINLEQSIETVKNALQPLTKKANINNYECDVCHKKYSTQAMLTKHKNNHCLNLIFKCTKCDAKLANQDELNNHMKIHSGYRPFCCQLCANTFSQQKNLKAHMKRIHNIIVKC